MVWRLLSTAKCCLAATVAEELECVRALLAFEWCRDGTEQEDGRDIKGEPSVAMQILHRGHGGEESSRKGAVRCSGGSDPMGTRSRIPAAEMRFLERFRLAATMRDCQGGFRAMLDTPWCQQEPTGSLWASYQDVSWAPCSLCVFWLQLGLEGRVAGVKWNQGDHQHQLDRTSLQEKQRSIVTFVRQLRQN